MDYRRTQAPSEEESSGVGSSGPTQERAGDALVWVRTWGADHDFFADFLHMRNEMRSWESSAQAGERSSLCVDVTSP